MLDEKVLVVPEEFCNLEMFKNHSFRDLCWDNGGNPTNCNVNINHLECNLLPNSLFMDRAEAEVDPKFKQLIPYCLICRVSSDGANEYFVYQRTKKGGEKRLMGMWSTNFGGHINPVDLEGHVHDIKMYNTALAREVLEETGITEFTHTLNGFIYDDSNDVGAVHLGIVHTIMIDVNTEPLVTESALCNGKWQTKEQIMAGKDNFENWSKIVIDNLLI